ncbi:MAG: serine hydrolase domain-containing protein, partial [Candidatus Sifarchaeia archaeon]
MSQSISNKDEKVKIYLDTQISTSEIPGIQYIVSDSSQTIFEYAGGWADIKNQKPMKISTTMMAYSMTKTITAAAILQLIEKNQLNLDDSVDLYLDNNPYGSTITIRHLLSQTSGIPNPIPLKWIHWAEIHEEFDEDAALNKVLKENPTLSFEPNKKYGYSNISYWLLGKIIERVSGQTYPSYVEENVLKTLQLAGNEMSYSIPDSANHAKGYMAKDFFIQFQNLVDEELIGEAEGTWIHFKNHYLNGPAFGGLVGSANSFSKFLQDQLRKESVLFSNETKTLFYTQQKNSAGD